MVFHFLNFPSEEGRWSEPDCEGRERSLSLSLKVEWAGRMKVINNESLDERTEGKVVRMGEKGFH
jgi:hypothetical protein